MRHYPIRTIEQGERKIFRERKGRFNTDELARGWHVQYDRFSEGRPIVPDAASLRPYDASAVMVALQVRNRLVEEVCPAVAPGFPQDLAASVRDIEEDIVRQAQHLRRLTEAHERRGREIEEVRAELDDRQRRLDEHIRWLEDALTRAAALETEVRAAHEVTDLVNRNALDLARRLDEAFASWSWRLTRPLRAAGRLFRGK